MKSLVPQKRQKAGSRRIEATRAHLCSGQVVSRFLWLKVSPRYRLLKLVMAPPIIVVTLAILILIALILALAILVLLLPWALSKSRRGEPQR